jgi:hypothetical protein
MCSGSASLSLTPPTQVLPPQPLGLESVFWYSPRRLCARGELHRILKDREILEGQREKKIIFLMRITTRGEGRRYGSMC